MGWLSAIGQGGQQGLDRYSQWRQLDQENQWKAAEEARRQMLADQERQTAEMQRKATQMAVTKGELENVTSRYAPGVALDDAGIAELSKLGAGHLFDPTTKTFRGTWEQQQVADRTRRENELFQLQKQEAETKVAELQRQRTAQANLDKWMQANPKADTRAKLQAAAQFGVSDLPVGLKEDLDYERALRVAGINSQAEIARLTYAQKLQEDALTKQRAAQLGQDYKTMPKSINELYAERAAEYIKNTKEQPGPELQAQVIMEWAGLQPRLAQTQRELKLPVTVGEAPGGSPYYRQQLQAIPAIAMQIANGATRPDEAMAEINNDKSLSGAEMQALRNQLRSYLQPLGFDMPVYTGTEKQAPSPVAAAIRPSSTFAANIRSGVGTGR